MTGPATTTLNARYTPPRGGMPKGVKMSDVWRGPDGQLVEHDVEIPVDANKRPTGWLYVCVVGDCTTTGWVFGDDPSVRPDPRCCPQHPVELVRAPLFDTDADPVAGARARAVVRMRQSLDARKQAAAAAAQRRVEALRAEAERAARQTHADFKGHLPSAAAGLATIAAGFSAVSLDKAMLTAAIGLGTATAGAVVAYAVAYVVGRWRLTARKGKSEVGLDRRRREIARRYGVAAVASGGWLALTAAANATLDTARGAVALLFALLLLWTVCKEHWREMSETRDRLRDLERRRLAAAAQAEADRIAREKAEEEARRRAAAEAAAQPVVEVVPNDRDAKNAWMLEQWRALQTARTLPPGLSQVLPLTHIVTEKTRELTVPVGAGESQHIGWEFLIRGEPGALTPIPGRDDSPLIGARGWIADVLGLPYHLVSLVDRPGGVPNTAALLISSSAPLDEVVTWQGRNGIRVGPDGALYGHIGRTLLGEDVYRVLWRPGQAGGGGRYGITGSGKTTGTQIAILNDLAAGIFPVVHDPKRFVDVADFAGVIPMGCSIEHREVIFRSLNAERIRRLDYLGTMTMRDRHDRVRPVDATWDVKRDGPPIRGIWEEFHDTALDDKFVDRLTNCVRFQRSSAIMQEAVTQGGGLDDMGNSVFRDQLNMISMELFRMSTSSARLAGYKGSYSPEELPPIPGTMLYIAGEGSQPVPMRGAYVTRKDVEGCLFDLLYSPEGELLLPAPSLPKATLEVFEREGLMDLWRLGQGEGGINRLLADAERVATSVDLSQVAGVPATAQTATSGGDFLAKDVLMVLIDMMPGKGRADVAYHPLWAQAGWAKLPNHSTITNALTALKREGKALVPEDSIYLPTPAGSVHAQTVRAQIEARNTPAASASDRSAAVLAEREALARAEQQAARA